MEALSFLQSVAGYARAQDGGSPNKPVKLGTVDPAYSGTGLPKVTFDGEDALSGKEYAYSYPVRAGDRVALIPVGTTYLIIGAIGGPSAPLAITAGGTGANNAATARSNLGANNAANLTTGALPVARLSTAIATASINMTPVANTSTSVTWTYGATLTGSVHIQATANSTAAGTVVEVCASGAGSTSCLIWVNRTNNTSTNVYCAAFGGF